MGADLYRRYRENPDKQVPIMGFERSKKAVDNGYFRDAYNNGSILWKYGLSWWTDISPLGEDGVIRTENVKVFRSMLDEKIFENNIKDLNEEDKKYFRSGATLLKDYLDQIINAGDSIEASL